MLLYSPAPAAHPPSPGPSSTVPTAERGADPVTCLWDDCGIIFTHRPTFIEHIHCTHIGVHKSNYTCEWSTCILRGLALTSRFALISHIRSHTDEKPFICPRRECDKSFTRPDALAKHMRLKHNFRWTDYADRIDPFAEGPHYGPVLEPFLAKVVGATIKLNPLLAPPADTQDDNLRWNMLFHPRNCYRTTESGESSSWTKGWNAPATHPRLTYIRIVSCTFPCMIQARAQNPKLGVVCREVLDAISACLYGDVAKKEYENLPEGKKWQIWEGYRFNRSTDLNAPGVRLGAGLKWLDFLGSLSRFGGLVANETFVREHSGDVLITLHI